MDYFCYRYYSLIESLREDNRIVREIIDNNKMVEDHSHLNYLVLSLYHRDISILELIVSSNRSKGSIPSVIRYLFMHLLSFKQLRELSEKEAVELADLLLDILTGNSRSNIRLLQK